MATYKLMYVPYFQTTYKFMGTPLSSIKTPDQVKPPHPSPLPPQTGERAGVKGKNKKGNSYTIKFMEKEIPYYRCLTPDTQIETV